jgi:hypothetical protein
LNLISQNSVACYFAAVAWQISRPFTVREICNISLPNPFHMKFAGLIMINTLSLVPEGKYEMLSVANEN